MIKGISKLSKKQVELMNEVSKKHISCVGNEYKDGYGIVEAWISKGIICVRLKNGDWFHYTENLTWY